MEQARPAQAAHNPRLEPRQQPLAGNAGAGQQKIDDPAEVLPYAAEMFAYAEPPNRSR
jgi:hypothetical protein